MHMWALQFELQRTEVKETRDVPFHDIFFATSYMYWICILFLKYMGEGRLTPPTDSVEDLQITVATFLTYCYLSLDQYLYDLSDHGRSDCTPLYTNIFRLILRLDSTIPCS
jgi:hypothetical protein